MHACSTKKHKPKHNSHTQNNAPEPVYHESAPEPMDSRSALADPTPHNAPRTNPTKATTTTPSPQSCRHANADTQREKTHGTRHTHTHRYPRIIGHTTVTYANKPKHKRNHSKELITLLSGLINPSLTWIRDLTEEGIEPNPGPRYVTKNVNGLQGAGKLFQCCKAIASEHERQPITALFIQEHNLKQQDKKAHEKIARGHQLLILLAYATPKQFQATSWGGTAIIIPHTSIEKKPGESLDDAILRIQKSTFRPAHLSGRAISTKMHVLGHPRTLTCAYAPAEPSTDLLGTEWTKVGTNKPKEGRELHTNTAQLTATLSQRPPGTTKASFTPAQITSMQLGKLNWTDFIKVKNNYWKQSATPARTTFFSALAAMVNPKTILGLDANCVPDTTLDTLRPAACTTPYENDGYKTLNNLTDDNGLTDVARQQLGSDGTNPFFTSHHSHAAGITHTRIDRIYVPDTSDESYVHSNCTDFFPHPDARATRDHDAVHVCSTQTTHKRGNDLPFINESIFDDQPFTSQLHASIRTRYNNAMRTPNTNWRSTWESIKLDARTQCLAETKRTRFKLDQQLTLKKLILANLRTRTTNGEQINEAEADRLEKEIKTARRKAVTLHDTLEGEAYNNGKKHDVGSSEFFRQWNPARPNQAPHKMQEADWTDLSNPTHTGNTVSSTSQILKEFTKYYTSLFADKNTDPLSHATQNCLHTLSDPDPDGNTRRVLKPTADLCDAPILAKEIADAISALPTGKSPGPDRLPCRFYKTFSETIALILHKVYEESIANNELHDTCLEGLISVLYKKGVKDDPRNYRPISLLNCDYKIFTRILTQRMNLAVLQFVSPQQTGFVQHSFIAENLMLLKLLQAKIEEEDEEAIYLFLDMEKAYDRCSWSYLKSSLTHLGFGDNFIKYVSLFYNESKPPKRKICINGHTGEPFELHSGVAQGCPLSSVLFLCITEALTRLVQHDPNIIGVETNGVRHKISQFADDTTLIAKPPDLPHMQKHLDTWCEATGMKENMNKREGLLLGRLRRLIFSAPKNIVPNWTPDGTPIRALGVPMGNRLDEEDWWHKRYRLVKTRIAAWKSLAHLTITGRNLLLQAILYGSLRYWLFSLIMPESILNALEEDSYNILWAQQPEIFSNEDGTSANARAYIHKAASYLPQKQGGGGVMHFRSHALAYYTQWIRRYIEPGNQPWKQVADLWLTDTCYGRGAILAKGNPYLGNVPTRARYLRRCLKTFYSLQLKQDTTKLTHTVQSEPIFDNWRFSIDIDEDVAKRWMKFIGLQRIYDVIDGAHARIFTDDEMDEYTYTHAPRYLKGAAARTFSDALMSTWPAIKAEITPAIVQAAISRDQPKSGDYLHIEWTNRNTQIALLKIDPRGNKTYHIQWLDSRNAPHDTGRTLGQAALTHAQITQAITWRTVQQRDENDSDEGEDINPAHYLQIAGPATTTFPSPDGWTTVQPSKTITNLTHLTIPIITQHYTEPHIQNTRPNCEKGWASTDPTEHRLPHITVPWPLVWESLGTPISDASEEKHWRKLLHRGIFVHNRQRDPTKTVLCRMHGCTHIESQLHIVQCHKLKPYWNLVFKFITTVLGEPYIPYPTTAIIFNMRSQNELLSEPTCAFIRHAFGCFYDAFSQIDLTNKPFTPTLVFHETLLSFRSAVLRYAYTIRLLYIKRRFTSKKLKTPPEEARKRLFAALVTINELDYKFKLTATFQKALDIQEAAVTLHYAHPPAPGNHPPTH